MIECKICWRLNISAWNNCYLKKKEKHNLEFLILLTSSPKTFQNFWFKQDYEKHFQMNQAVLIYKILQGKNILKTIH